MILRLLYKILAELILKDALKMRYLGGHDGARAVLIQQSLEAMCAVFSSILLCMALFSVL
ncbi:MAG: hypothetical protein SPJ69_04320 [Campylobacter sp.]|nr:hypothetical protein [Campylobacter sp.]